MIFEITSCHASDIRVCVKTDGQHHPWFQRKTNHQISNLLRNINLKVVLFKHVHQSLLKMTSSVQLPWQVNLCKTDVLIFCLNQTSFTFKTLIRKPTETWALYICFEQDCLFCLIWEEIEIFRLQPERDRSKICFCGYIITLHRLAPFLKDYYSCQVWIILLLHIQR